MASSKTAIGALNFIAMLLSIPIIVTGFRLSSKADNTCVKLLQWPVIILGILVLVVALIGFIGAIWRVQCLLLMYLMAMLLVIIILAGAVVFIYMITNKGSGHPVPNRAFLEYRLEDYSGWLRPRVVSAYKWDRIKSCLTVTSMCSELDQQYRLPQDFFNAHISPLQSGCCKPPTPCGYTFVNPTYWTSPINTAADLDCLLWSNEQTQLCYACDSCKAGLLANLMREWKRADYILMIVLVALILVYLIGWCVFWNAKVREMSQPRRNKQGHE